jgi:hypothetical protein
VDRRDPDESAGRAVHPGLPTHADPALLQLRGEPDRRAPFRVPDVDAVHGVLPEGQGRWHRDVVLREVVLPSLRPPVARERAGAPDHRAADRAHPGLHDRAREVSDLRPIDLGIAVADDPQVPVDHATPTGLRRRLRLGEDPLPRCVPVVQRHRQQELLVGRGRPADPTQVSVPLLAVRADRDRDRPVADGGVDVLHPRRSCGRSDPDGLGGHGSRRGGRRARGQGERGGEHEGEPAGAGHRRMVPGA